MAGLRYAETERIIWRTLLRPLPPNAKLVYMALRTGPDGCSLPGIVETDAARLVSDTGLVLEVVREALEQLRAARLVEVDDRYCVMRDLGATPAPRSQTSHKTVLGWWRVYEQLPPSDLLPPFLAVLRESCDFRSEGVADAWSKTFGRLRNPEAPSEGASHGAPEGAPDAPSGGAPEGASHGPFEGASDAPSNGASGGASHGAPGSRACAPPPAPARDSEQRAAGSEQQPDEKETSRAHAEAERAEAERVRLNCEVHDQAPAYKALLMACRSAPGSRLVHAVASVGERAAAADGGVDATLHAVQFVEHYGRWRRGFPMPPSWSPEAIEKHAVSVQRVMAGLDPMPELGRGRAGPAPKRKGPGMGVPHDFTDDEAGEMR